MLNITMKNGGNITYKEKEYTDYEYLKDIFVVLKDSKWVGVFNMDCVEYVLQYDSFEDEME